MDGYNNRFRKGLAARPQEWVSAQEQEAKEEWNPNTPPVLTNRGTFQTVSGGMPQFKSTLGTAGGTVLMEVDPVTGVTTIRGGFIAQQTLDLGTINNTVLAGALTLNGTLANNRLINNGTYNSGTFGSPTITGGSWATGTLTGATLGTPNATGGTHNNAFLGTVQTAGGTLGTPVITGIPIFDVNAGSAALGAAGAFAIQTHSGSAILAARVGTITYLFFSGGTMI